VKTLFIAATSMNDGKTTLSLGLMEAFASRGLKVGFLKPVGQRYKETDEGPIDEDSLLVASTIGMTNGLVDLSPIAVERDFTRRYLDAPDVAPLEARIRASFSKVASGKDVVIVEGTGHSGVGSVFDLSNSRVAQMLEAKVLIVTVGGIGRPVDELCLNQCLYRSMNVPIIGAVLNKTRADKCDEVRRYAAKALARRGMRLLGVVPEQKRLSGPTLAQIVVELGGEVLNGEKDAFTATIEHIVVGAMSAHNALSYFRPNSLVITPGDREDLVLAAMTNWLTTDACGPGGGIILTGGIMPHENILKLIQRSCIPVVLMKEDSYSVAGRIRDLNVKIQPSDHEKIALAKRVVAENVDVAAILEAL